MKRAILLLFAILSCSAAAVAQWTATDGPYIGLRTYEVLTIDSMLMVDTNCEPLFSTDHGNTWGYVQYSGYYGSDVAGHFRLNGKTYFHSHWRYFWSVNTSGAIPAYDPVRSFPVDVFKVEADASGIYAATVDNGLLMSPTDSNFILYGDGLPVDTVAWDTIDHRYSLAVALDSQYVFLGTRHGVYRATKGVFQFAPINNGLPSTTVRNLFCKDSVLVADAGSMLYWSHDFGQNWAGANVPAYTYCYRIQEFRDTIYACVSPGGVIFSIDQGQNWALVDSNWAYITFNGMTQLGNELFLANDEGLWKGLRPALALDYNGCGTVVKSMAKSGNCIAASTNYDVNFSTDGGDSWEKFPNRNGFDYHNLVVGLDGGLVWSTNFSIGSQEPMFFFSQDCAASWDSLSITGTYQQIFLSSDGSHLIANFFSPAGYWMFTDSGNTQTEILRPSTVDCQADPILIVDGNAIYATSCDNTELLRTYDLGQNWTYVGAGLPQDRVCYMERLGGRLFATYADDIYQAVSGDSLWTHSRFGIPGNSGPFFDLEWDGQQYYVCNGSKVWASLDGMHWLDVSQGLPAFSPPNQDFSGMVIAGGRLYVGTWGRGVWKRPLSELSVLVPRPVLPGSLHLYPNPASESVYWTNPETVVTMKCFNLLGQPVIAPQMGDHLDVSGLQEGIYLLRAGLRDGSTVSGRILVKR